MINNNPYNLPERPPNKPNRIYTQINPTQYRPLQIQSPTPYSQYLARQNHHLNSMNTKTSLGLQQNMQHRPPNYPSLRNEIKHYLPSPKNLNNSGKIINNFNSNSITGSGARIGSSLQKKQISSINNQIALRQSLGINILDIKQINEKIDIICLQIKNYQTRITQLQKNTTSPILTNNTKYNQTQITNNIENSLLFTKYQNQCMDNINKIKQEIENVKNQITNNKVNNSNNNSKINNQLDKIIMQKCRDILQDAKIVSHTQLANFNRYSSQQFKKQIESLRHAIQQKMKKNFQFLTSVIGRLQRQCHNGLIQPNPLFKSSTIKCTTTAILLRFLQCFKVRKHTNYNTQNTKNGQTKIIIADTTYYIDNQGYLLDKDQFYIVDSRDCRIRLQEQHVRLLKQQGILL